MNVGDYVSNPKASHYGIGKIVSNDGRYLAVYFESLDEEMDYAVDDHPLFIKQKVMKQFPGYEIFPQAKFNRRYLFQSTTGKKILQMAPDILIRDPEGNHLVIDTKWKRLKSDNLKSQSNVSSSDLYQLYAYTHRYGCRQSILLYPRVSGVVEQDYHLLDHNDQCTDNKVALRLVNLYRNLHSKQEQNRLADELEDLIVSGFTKKDELFTVSMGVA